MTKISKSTTFIDKSFTITIYFKIEPVRLADGSLIRNFLNFDFENFNMTERGDLRDLVDHLRIEGMSPNQDGEDSLPSLFNE